MRGIRSMPDKNMHLKDDDNLSSKNDASLKTSSSNFLSDKSEISNPSTVLQRKRTAVEIKDATVDDNLQLGNGVTASSGNQDPNYFNVKDMEVVAPKIRKRRALKTFLIILAIAFFVVVGFVVGTGSLTTNASTKTNSSKSQSVTAYKNLGIIDLESFYGLSLNQVYEKLGSSFKLESNKQAPTGSAASTYMIFVNQNELEDQWASAPTRVVAMLDSSGKTIGVGYTVSMDRAGFETEDFSDLVGTDEALLATLDAAGISDVVTTYTAPDPQTYTTYADPKANTKQVSRYSTTFTGATGYTNLPDTWSVTFEYNYMHETEDGSKTLSSEPIRTINIVLD